MATDQPLPILPGLNLICCARCVFFLAPPIDPKNLGAKSPGICRRFPPSVVVAAPAVMSGGNKAMTAPPSIVGVRPNMEPHDFCGEFRPPMAERVHGETPEKK